jgi:hypothetical protein
MDNLKRAWINELTPDLLSITLESEHILPDIHDLQVVEMTGPVEPTPEHPKRHTINLGYFSIGDLIEINETLDKFIREQIFKMREII